MVAAIKPQTKTAVNVYELLCDFCALVKPRRNGVDAVVDDRNRFICAECCERSGAGSYSQVFGDPRLLASLLFAEAAP